MSDSEETGAVGDPAGLAQALADLPADLPPTDAEADNPPQEAETPENATSEAEEALPPALAPVTDRFLGISDEELIAALRSRAHADHAATGSRESRHIVSALDAVRGHTEQRRRSRNR